MSSASVWCVRILIRHRDVTRPVALLFFTVPAVKRGGVTWCPGFNVPTQSSTLPCRIIPAQWKPRCTVVKCCLNLRIPDAWQPAGSRFVLRVQVLLQSVWGLGVIADARSSLLKVSPGWAGGWCGSSRFQKVPHNGRVCKTASA